MVMHTQICYIIRMQTGQPIPKWLMVIVRIPRAIVQTIFKGPLRPVLDWFTRQIYSLEFHFSAHETFDGINLYCVDDDEKEMFFETAIKALKLLQTNDPRRYCRVKKYLKNIALSPTGNGHFQGANSSFIVDSFDYSRASSFAAEIVHEATHGLLDSRGFRYETDKRRHETICIREQFRTARRLIYKLNPDLTAETKNEMVGAWKTWMETALQDEWWDPHKQLQRGLGRLISIWHEETITPLGVYLLIREKDDGRHFLIRNSIPSDVTVTIKLTSVENGHLDFTPPWTRTISPKVNLTAFTITPINPAEALKYQCTWNWRYKVLMRFMTTPIAMDFLSI